MSLIGLPRLLLLSNSRTNQAFYLSGIDTFRWQCSGHVRCILTLDCHNHALWTHPRLSQSSTKSYLTTIQPKICPKANVYHVVISFLFFITTCWPVRYRILNLKKKEKRKHCRVHSECNKHSYAFSKEGTLVTASELPYCRAQNWWCDKDWLTDNKCVVQGNISARDSRSVKTAI